MLIDRFGLFYWSRLTVCMVCLESVVFYLVRELMNLLQGNPPEWLIAILVASLMDPPAGERVHVVGDLNVSAIPRDVLGSSDNTLPLPG